MKVHCETVGEYIAHFIGYGEGTQILCRTLKIHCDRTHNSEEIVHRFHIYDFTPYEDNYTLEIEDFNNDTTQAFKKQKLPYKSGEQPFPMVTQIPEDTEKINELKGRIKDFDSKLFIDPNKMPIENIESESFLRQYEKAKNTKEHVYQYIGRENFSENAIESYEGKSLQEIFEKINKHSKYFKGRFYRSGTNTLLNDFMQFAPNGFIYRMGLLNSEIYQTLGVLPTYSYMSDKLFRWDPGEEQLLDLIPKKKSFNWGENIWAGKGWIIYRVPTQEYLTSDSNSNSLTQTSEIISSVANKQTAEEMVKKLEKLDEIERNQIGSTVIQYRYYIVESLYETGVFFVNIPITKIPTNFYIPSQQFLTDIINKTKPCGTKAIINYVVEENFDQIIDFDFYPNYEKETIFTSDISFDEKDVTLSKFVQKSLTCNDRTITYPSFSPFYSSCSNYYDIGELELVLPFPKIETNMTFDLEQTIEETTIPTQVDYTLEKLSDLLELLYQNNYNNISFRIEGAIFSIKSKLTPASLVFSKNEFNNLCFSGQDSGSIDGIKLKIPNKNIFNKGESSITLEIEDDDLNKHRISTQFNPEYSLNYITCSYENKYGKEFIRKKGYQDIKDLNVIIEDIHDKKILIFMVGDEKNNLHYFHHVIVNDVVQLRAYKTNSNNSTENLYKSILSVFYLFDREVVFETPFVMRTETYYPSMILSEKEWEKLERLNENDNSYAYIKNETKDYYAPGDIKLFYDEIDIPETSIVKSLNLKVEGKSSSVYDLITAETAYNIGYLVEDLYGDEIQLEPTNIECYDFNKENNNFYEASLNKAIINNQFTLAETLENLMDENIIFNEDIHPSIEYLSTSEAYLPINQKCWYEISDFYPGLYHNLNEIKSIYFVIEGFNTGPQCTMSYQILNKEKTATPEEIEIESGYFRKKIKTNFSNQYSLDLISLRFRFKDLINEIKLFDTKLELKFSKKQTDKDIEYESINDIQLQKQKSILLLKNYSKPSDLNNGMSVNLKFDDLRPGAYYQLNSIKLELIYQETEFDMVLLNKQYYNKIYNKKGTLITGELSDDAYLSGRLYTDVENISQIETNVGKENKGIKLQDSLYQMFETRKDNITAIEIFPYGFKGNPDEILKIGLYKNSYNTPGELIKEIYADGWLKTNETLKNLDRIKYNFNVSNLDPDTKYWFKFEILNPSENSYYLLNGINNTKQGFKLLSIEDNNYINTFGNLKFIIYSKEKSLSFNHFPGIQNEYYNPYITIGLHKNIGEIRKLGVHVNKEYEEYKKDMIKMNNFNSDFNLKVFQVIKKTGNTEEIIISEEEEE